MASRIIHLAITDRILKGYRCKDRNRLELGSILPDAAAGGNSHLKTGIANGTKKTYDLTAFRSKFLTKMTEDDLYLGYYMHLIQDMYFRNFVYNRYHWNPLPPGNVERLHHDYALINQYVVQKYALTDTITVPSEFDAEPLNELGPFTIRQFLADMKTDFHSSPTGTAFFFTPKMADEFITLAGEKCEHEIDSLYNGLDCIDEKTLAWRNFKFADSRSN
mgnify:CR=1 FL=1